MLPPRHEPQLLLSETLNASHQIHNILRLMLQRAPTTAILKIAETHKPVDNPLRIFDRQAEEWFGNYIKEGFADIDVVGEEDPRLLTSDFTHSGDVIFLVDMVDGSDLLMTGLENWCSAIICFAPSRKRIVFAVIAHSNGCRYFASEDQPGAYVEIPRRSESTDTSAWARRALAVNKSVKRMSEARICYYGQKWKHVLVADNNFYAALGSGGRMYNLAGNPMMAKLAEGKVDAVFDIVGQKAHDVVPGAYVALRAGAVMKTPEGHEINEDDLFKKLLVPNSDIRYVLAGTEDLCNDICSNLAGAMSLEEALKQPAARGS